MPKLTPIPPAKRVLIAELLGRGMKVREIADNLGYTYGQVKGTVERYRLRKEPAPRGTPKFNPEQKAKLLAMAQRMVLDGKTLPMIAEEIERVSGKPIASNTVREWMPAHLTPRIRENARTAIAAHSRTRGHHQRQRLKAIMEENQRLRDEVRRLRGKLNRLERTTT